MRRATHNLTPFMEKQTELTTERERIRWRTFDMKIVTFTESNRALLGLSPLEKVAPNLDDNKHEWDEDEVVGP